MIERVLSIFFPVRLPRVAPEDLRFTVGQFSSCVEQVESCRLACDPARAEASRVIFDRGNGR